MRSEPTHDNSHVDMTIQRPKDTSPERRKGWEKGGDWIGAKPPIKAATRNTRYKTHTGHLIPGQCQRGAAAGKICTVTREHTTRLTLGIPTPAHAREEPQQVTFVR